MSSTEKPRRRLRVALDDLETAMEETSWDVDWYLDLKTGEVTAVDRETRQELEEICEEMPGVENGEPDDIASALAQRDLPPWRREALLNAAMVERGFGGSFISVPRTDSREAYRDMEDFISTVQDPRLGDRLSRAIQGRGAFGRFRDILARSRRDQERWFQFKQQRVRERAMEWLEKERVDVAIEFEVERQPDPPPLRPARD